MIHNILKIKVYLLLFMPFPLWKIPKIRLDFFPWVHPTPVKFLILLRPPPPCLEIFPSYTFWLIRMASLRRASLSLTLRNNCKNQKYPELPDVYWVYSYYPLLGKIVKSKVSEIAWFIQLVGNIVWGANHPPPEGPPSQTFIG